MRLESVTLIAAVAIASGLAYAWWASRRRTRQASLERDGVVGRAAVTGVTREAGGAIRIAYRFRHPFTGAGHDGSGALPLGMPLPAVGDEVEIAYLPDDPQQSCLAAQWKRP
jgi:hypothetical protein